jgi:hypothetical protein
MLQAHSSQRLKEEANATGSPFSHSTGRIPFRQSATHLQLESKAWGCQSALYTNKGSRKT